ncbi:hypothetical protein [Sphingosinicella sp. BN140058]|uniref:hypothetical protein n=1 Tax=Sphingosinicella sp. BN140058 TaxID=1892855 RepID=UPI0010104562|nr:hypothetical protein [Sphingosinicella sp. BN140058]QAY80272.1 hypothetical protein ETR14_26880 [Sphingosinicella sp. BN140058]
MEPVIAAHEGSDPAAELDFAAIAGGSVLDVVDAPVEFVCVPKLEHLAKLAPDPLDMFLAGKLLLHGKSAERPVAFGVDSNGRGDDQTIANDSQQRRLDFAAVDKAVPRSGLPNVPASKADDLAQAARGSELQEVGEKRGLKGRHSMTAERLSIVLAVDRGGFLEGGERIVLRECHV